LSSSLSFKHRLIVALLVLNAGIYFVWLYFPVLSWGYIWDDLSFLRDALNYKPGAPLHPAVFSGSNFYRPVGYLSFVLEAKLFGVNPSVSHAINIGFLLLLMAVLFITAFGLLADKMSVMARVSVSLLLIVSVGSLPLMGEPIAWVSARFELMSTFFMMVGVALYCFMSGVKLRGILLGCFFLLALLSKESVAPALLLFPLTLALREWRGQKAFYSVFIGEQFLRPFLALMLAFVLYLALRLVRFDGDFAPVSVFDFYSPFEHMRLIFESLTQYLDILFRPWIYPPPYFVVDFAQPAQSGWWLTVFLCSAVILLFAVAAIRTGCKPLLIPLMFFVWLLPVSNVLPIFPGLFSVAPRYLVAPVLMTAVTVLLWLPARVSRVTVAVFWVGALAVAIVAVPANRDFVKQYETNERFWDVLVERYGLYHAVVAMNAITSKAAMSNYDAAHERFVVAREKLDLGEAFVDRYVYQLAYGRGSIDDSARDVAKRKLDEVSSGLSLLSMGQAAPLLDLVRWLNTSALFMVHDCRSMDEIYRIGVSSLNIETDVVAQIVTVASTSPLLFSLIGYPLEKFDSPFKQEQGRELVRLLQRDLKRCGVVYSIIDGPMKAASTN